MYCWLHYPKKQAIEFFILGIILTFGIQVLVDHLTRSPEEQQISDLENRVKGLSIQNQDLIDGKNTLISQNAQLSEKLSEYQGDLDQKEQKIKELEERARKAGRGVTSTYDFNGRRRETTKPGHFLISDGPEVEVFRRMQELERRKDYADLATLCEEQIEKTPEWLTPYLYLGLASANSGNRNRAIELFEYVNEESSGDPAYSKANEFLEELRDK